MSKFKVGDKVVRTGMSNDGVVTGGIYTISDGDTYGGNSGCIRIDGSKYTYTETYFDLYEEPKAVESKVKPKFKVGDKVVAVDKGKPGQWAGEGAIGYITNCYDYGCTVEFVSGDFMQSRTNEWAVAYESIELVKEEVMKVQTKKQPHVHAELIKAWADGADIEYYSNINGDIWINTPNPDWYKGTKYRIKPISENFVVKTTPTINGKIYALSFNIDGSSGNVDSIDFKQI
jgi:hypothetical protein